MRIIQKFTLYLVGFIFILAIYSGIIIKAQMEIKSHLDHITLSEKGISAETEHIRTIVNSVIKNNILLSVFAALAGTFFNLLIARSIVRPLAKLKNATVEINNGKIGTKAEINLKDEIGELAVSFNCMSENLKESSKKIQEEMKYIEVINKELQASMEEAKCSNIELRQSNEKLESATKELHLISNMAQKAKEIAEKKVEEVEQFNKIAVGRELRIRELKERITGLEEELKRRES
ncbi:MAG: HAMP domain-containing protein [bacterium]|nr:HAMP domain-containing protein [bacterium]